MKRCSKCKIIKELSEFPTDRSHANGHESRCKACKAIYMREYHQRENVRKRIDITLKTDIRYIEKRRERHRRYRLEKRYSYKQKHNLEKRRINDKNRRESDPKIKLHDSVRARIRHDLKRGKFGITSNEILKKIFYYDIEKLKRHLEKQFKEGMTWGNYGLSGWHIDHKIPVAAFNFKSPNDIDFKRCWSLENLQPMWAKDNCTKGARITKPFQPSLLL